MPRISELRTDLITRLAQVGDRSGLSSEAVTARLPNLTADEQIALIREGMTPSESQALLAELPSLNLDAAALSVFESVLGISAPVVPAQPAPVEPLQPRPSTGRLESVVHYEGPTEIQGARLNASALSQIGIELEKLGTTTVELPQPDGTSKSYVVRDMQYELANGKVGMRLVPVADHDAAASAQMDAIIREESGLQPNDPIYTLVAYIHPEENKGTLRDMGGRFLKTEMGATHLGAYLGEAKTTNSPGGYHGNTWGVGHGLPYPANVQVLSMEGVDQATLNKNLVMADAVLNDGVEFPGDYKNDPFRTVDLNTTLMFYRDWIKGEDYLHDDETWHTYCAEHKTVAVNVGLNVPHNLESFQEIFGAEGTALWEQFKGKFEELNNRPFTAADETRFEPLWKKEGLTADQIRAPSKEEYDAFEDARFEGQQALHAGWKPLPAGKGLAWRPETTADLLKNFVETYASFQDVGAYPGIATIMSFKDQVVERLGVGADVFMGLALPVMNKMVIAEAMARGPTDPAQMEEWSKTAAASIYVSLGGTVDELTSGQVKPELMQLAQACLSGLGAAQADIARVAARPQEERETLAYAFLRKSIEEDVEKARGVQAGRRGLTEAYSPPAVTNRVVNGLVEKSKFIDLRVVATAVDVGHVE